MISAGVDPFLVARLGEYKSAGGGLEVRFNCPECVKRRHQSGIPDREQKLYVNFSRGVFFCQRCFWKGSIDYLYKSLGLIKTLPKGVLEILPTNLAEEVGIDKDDPVEPSGSIGVPDTSQDFAGTDAWLWLWKRLQSIGIEELYELMSETVFRRGVKKYWHRVFICDVYRGETRYWQARTYLDGVKPKYLSPWGISRNEVLFNQQYVEDYSCDPVIICEGMLSAIVAGRDAVATYGRVVTTGQLEMLSGLDCREFIIAAESDPDAKKDASKVAEGLQRRGKKVYILEMPKGEDPASLGRSVFRSMLDDAVPYDWRYQVLRRLYARA